MEQLMLESEIQIPHFLRVIFALKFLDTFYYLKMHLKAEKFSNLMIYHELRKVQELFMFLIALFY